VRVLTPLLLDRPADPADLNCCHPAASGTPCCARRRTTRDRSHRAGSPISLGGHPSANWSATGRRSAAYRLRPNSLMAKTTAAPALRRRMANWLADANDRCSEMTRWARQGLTAGRSVLMCSARSWPNAPRRGRPDGPPY
jgi:hypothetical protein